MSVLSHSAPYKVRWMLRSWTAPPLDSHAHIYMYSLYILVMCTYREVHPYTWGVCVGCAGCLQIFGNGT